MNVLPFRASLWSRWNHTTRCVSSTRLRRRQQVRLLTRHRRPPPVAVASPAFHRTNAVSVFRAPSQQGGHGRTAYRRTELDRRLRPVRLMSFQLIERDHWEKLEFIAVARDDAVASDDVDKQRRLASMPAARWRRWITANCCSLLRCVTCCSICDSRRLSTHSLTHHSRLYRTADSLA